MILKKLGYIKTGRTYKKYLGDTTIEVVVGNNKIIRKITKGKTLVDLRPFRSLEEVESDSFFRSALANVHYSNSSVDRAQKATTRLKPGFVEGREVR
jgi:DNA-binding transcriptional regulator of glucitol operon